MNTITDLRRTLDRHAGDLPDPAAVARTLAVHHRIAAVRRRRRAAGTGLLAAAVVAGAALVAWPRSDDAAPAGPVVLGERAPGSIRSLGYAFDATGRTQVVDGSGTIRLAASETPRLLSWTLRGATSVRFTMPGPEVHLTDATRFGDFLYVPAGQAETVRVQVARGSVGIATYALSDRVTPAGYTRAGVTYRATVAGVHLLAAAVADPGRTSVTTSFVVPDGSVSLGVMCTNLPRGYVVNVSYGNGGPVSSSGCDSDGTFDPGASSFTESRVRHPGRTVRLRAWISRGFHDTARVPDGSVPHLTLGVGAYGPVPERRVDGVGVPVEIESQGHTWRLDGSILTTDRGALTVPPAAHDRLATVVSRSPGRTRLSVRYGQQTTGSLGRGSGALPGLWLAAGDRLRASLGNAPGSIAVALYTRVG